MAGGSGESGATIPRLSGVSKQGPTPKPCSKTGSSTYSAGAAWNWMSGAASSALERMNPPASAMFEVKGPRPSLDEGARFASVSESNSETGSS